jgi:hypothetical protein
MVTIDAQVHAYERDHPGRPWSAVLHGPPEGALAAWLKQRGYGRQVSSAN